MIGERIKELRTELCLSQAKVAKAIGYSQASVQDWEVGNKRPTSEAIIVLAQFFNVTADYLLGLSNDYSKVIK